MKKFLAGFSLSLISVIMIATLIIVAGGSITSVDLITMAVFSIAANYIALKKGWLQAIVLDIERENAQVRRRRLGK